MKCIITGHTGGVGKAIYDHFLSKGWEVQGMSRSNGYDISVDQDRIVSEATGCDIFVNCAYAGDAQTELLDKLKDKVKSMIVVGSVAADWARIWKDYGESKERLQDKCKELSLEDNTTYANIFYLKLAFCENTQWPIFVDEKYKVSFVELIKIIDMWIEVPKIFSVEFTLKKTAEIMSHAKQMNPHD
jgi:hypothetical protein